MEALNLMEYLIYAGLIIVIFPWIYGIVNKNAFLPLACIGHSLGFWMIAFGFMYERPFDNEWINVSLCVLSALLGLGAWIEFKTQRNLEYF
jgi:hypothetical protein